ncbi:hypothetical protein [Mucilaginibacter sp. UR6-11]|uniref:hypothetical protein n=1 Tax=Mucilaginibacter sp. UR6-11 TaxID=1435644 RepID=UPI001E5DFF2F|nr:hypothetical protein [Mucilaginibacter sp. UR6-11]MCC8426404.1 hypothetical protein [Mucilaginibacter sp. UR6-11]
MIPIATNDQTYFLSIVHITKQAPDHLIYGILINDKSYYLSKTVGLNDCRQLDNRVALEDDLMQEVCEIITSFEKIYQEYPSLDFINREIIKSLVRLRKTAVH